jgi:pullulanase
VALRKHHPAFRMPSTAMIQQYLEFLDMGDPLVIAYRLNKHANGDAWKNILVLLNGDGSDKTLKLPAGNWTLAANEDGVKRNGIRQNLSGTVKLPGTCAYVLFQE